MLIKLNYNTALTKIEIHKILSLTIILAQKLAHKKINTVWGTQRTHSAGIPNVSETKKTRLGESQNFVIAH